MVILPGRRHPEVYFRPEIYVNHENVVAIAEIEIRQYSQSLKEKRQFVKSLFQRLGISLLSIAEVDGLDTWHAKLGLCINNSVC